jgi:uncharacterized protein YodC (DUF2158 family)
MAFHIGEVVHLKSGGPDMTVESITGEDHVVCVWFQKKELSKQAFSAATLVKGSGKAPGKTPDK